MSTWKIARGFIAIAAASTLAVALVAAGVHGGATPVAAIWAEALVVAALAAGACWLMARRLARGAEEVRRAAERFAAGDLARRADPPEAEPFRSLARDLNRMAALLD